jgi:hypothetical protein
LSQIKNFKDYFTRQNNDIFFSMFVHNSSIRPWLHHSFHNSVLGAGLVHSLKKNLEKIFTSDNSEKRFTRLLDYVLVWSLDTYRRWMWYQNLSTYYTFSNSREFLCTIICLSGPLLVFFWSNEVFFSMFVYDPSNY